MFPKWREFTLSAGIHLLAPRCAPGCTDLFATAPTGELAVITPHGGNSLWLSWRIVTGAGQGRDWLPATARGAVGEFRLLARLGSGGMGQVFLGSSLAGRMVAVKVIHGELGRDPEFVRRFRHEVAAAQKVSGWYTAPVVAAGVDDNPPWLATAFVPGPSLEEIVTRHGPLPLPAVWRLAAGLAEALRAIHGTGLVHRDLKPANVLLALDGPR